VTQSQIVNRKYVYKVSRDGAAQPGKSEVRMPKSERNPNFQLRPASGRSFDGDRVIEDGDGLNGI